MDSIDSGVSSGQGAEVGKRTKVRWYECTKGREPAGSRQETKSKDQDAARGGFWIKNFRAQRLNNSRDSIDPGVGSRQ